MRGSSARAGFPYGREHIFDATLKSRVSLSVSLERVLASELGYRVPRLGLCAGRFGLWSGALERHGPLRIIRSSSRSSKRLDARLDHSPENAQVPACSDHYDVLKETQCAASAFQFLRIRSEIPSKTRKTRAAIVPEEGHAYPGREIPRF